ncbi:MAG: nickel pincer cofactor biosynthesis protein LarC [Spirochaetes bacterium]|nr:nickel pincer cofactor biosynthesis protein LarC [Spirochaetota bacterium]
MKILYIDAFSGVSGDKFNAALLSLGLDKNRLTDELSTLSISNEFQIDVEEKKIMGINTLKFNVIVKHQHRGKNSVLLLKNEDHSHGHRGLEEIIKIIKSSKISENAKKHAIDVFKIIGEAEAKVHGISIEKVHFHEVGAIDSIVDIVSACILMDQLKPDRVVSSPIALGDGFVKTDHGLLPVPAPATIEILRDVPSYGGSIDAELTTPTGAALIKYFVKDFNDMPLMKVENTGYGSGTKDFEIPNFLRMFNGIEYKKLSKKDQDDLIISLESNIDDSTPEQLAFLTNKMLELGALDVFIAPIMMKKSRQAQLLTVLCSISDKEKFENEIFLNSTTFGIRCTYHSRVTLKREIRTIKIDGIDVKVKLGYLDGRLIQKSFEYESVKEAVEKLNISYNEFIAKANLVLAQMKY